MLIYRIVTRKNPKNHTQRHYPALVSPQPIFADQVIARIERRCTLASADVKAVVDAIEVELIDNLSEGKSVRLGDLGTFRLSLRTKGSLTPEEVSIEKIRGTHVVFTPSPKIRRAMSVKGKALKFAKLGEHTAPNGTAPAPSSPDGGDTHSGGSASPGAGIGG